MVEIILHSHVHTPSYRASCFADVHVRFKNETDRDARGSMHAITREPHRVGAISHGVVMQPRASSSLCHRAGTCLRVGLCPNRRYVYVYIYIYLFIYLDSFLFFSPSLQTYIDIYIYI